MRGDEEEDDSNLANNQFTGSAQYSVSQMTPLKYRNLAHNQLKKLAIDFTKLTSLSILDLSSNTITGSLPNTMSSLTSAMSIHPSSQKFVGYMVAYQLYELCEAVGPEPTRVPNIKFNVAKVLQSLIPIVDQSVVEKTIRPGLVELSEDPDVDVSFFANQALQSIDNVMMSS
ncbi:unnamed protein product [Eruca vesicaria subsp. sativa]|uniref:Uncharacterized protein n=1 Tax=Eruca vesicaria subsp. sativa TaxID=29727 RepID=A0ABC8L2F7_ERUVS|nr:unnamed protein product [Eruca vesicaria subsp. sativa]